MEQLRTWRRLNGASVKQRIDDEVRAALISEKNAGHNLKLCIGTDSQVKGNLTAFATVILFVRQGMGGFMYISKEVITRKIGISERMLTEVAKSVETANALQGISEQYNVPIEVHADINTDPSFKSSESLNEAVGFISAMGLQFKVKPDAFASSSCANRVVQ